MEMPLILAIIVLIIALMILFDKYHKATVNTQDLARKQYQAWVDTEVQNIRATQLELARREAGVELVNREQGIRKDAIERSRFVNVGKVTEHLAPYLPDFKFNPKDVRFIGSPIDLLVFDGLDEGELRKIVFTEVKTGPSATLTKRERQIREAIREGRVEWHEFRVETNDHKNTNQPNTQITTPAKNRAYSGVVETTSSADIRDLAFARLSDPENQAKVDAIYIQAAGDNAKLVALLDDLIDQFVVKIKAEKKIVD